LAERERLEAALEDAGRDHERLAQLGHELVTAGEAVRVAEERWLALAAEAEAVGLDVVL
jgi:hypothetical protein